MFLTPAVIVQSYPIWNNNEILLNIYKLTVYYVYYR